MSGPIFAYAGLEATVEGARYARDYLRRIVPLVGAMRSVPGCLWVEAGHNGSHERAILSWWTGRRDVETWYGHPAHQDIVEYGYGQRDLLESGAVKTWIEFYEPGLRAAVSEDRAALLIGRREGPGCLARRSLSTGIHRFEFSWVEPDFICEEAVPLMRQLEWGVRTAADAGAPFSKARLLRLGTRAQ